MKKTKQKPSLTDSLLMILLLIVTITQFSSWGYQSVRFFLGKLFNVINMDTTALDASVGLIAMIASLLLFTGIIMRWQNKIKAKNYLDLGVALFIGKNILDLINSIILFDIKYPGPKNMSQINSLASSLGLEFFQLAFWIVVFIYFGKKYKDSK